MNRNSCYRGTYNIIRWCLTLCTTILNDLYTSLVLLLTNTCSNYYTYFISYILNISKIVLWTNVQCYKVSSDPNEALKYLSPCEREAIKGFSQLCIESLILKSSKAVHIYHLGEITNISLPLSKYHFSSLYGFFKAKSRNLNLKLGFTNDQTNEAEANFQLSVKRKRLIDRVKKMSIKCRLTAYGVI